MFFIFVLESCVNRIHYFSFCQFERSCLYWWSNVMFRNVSDYGRLLIIEVGNVCFITDISETVAWNDCYSTHRWVFSLLFSDFGARELRSIPTPPMATLTEFFHANTVTIVHPIPDSWYFYSSSLWQCLCSCMHMITIFLLVADTVTSCCWFIVLDITGQQLICCLRFLSWFKTNLMR